ncbi:MAG TPA: VanZ family protein [Acidiferrobacteraceae bacterium]|nr:VanZ family protein [Acidiferrobacteraceae bacterium]
MIRVVSTTIAVLIIGGIFYGGSQDYAVGLFQPPNDKWAHAAVFGLLTYLLWLGKGRGRVLWVAVFVLAVSALDEYHQGFLDGRYASLGDILASLTGIMGITLALLVANARERVK